MRKFNRLIAALLAAVTLLSLCGCGGSKGVETVKEKGGKNVWYLGGQNYGEKKSARELLGNTENTIDPASIYSTTEFTEQLVQGIYTLDNQKADLKKFRKEIPFHDVQFPSGTYNISVLPAAVYLGDQYITGFGIDIGFNYFRLKYIEDREVAVLSFAMEEELGNMICVYEVDGNTITFRQVEIEGSDAEDFSYTLTGIEFSYDFTIAGPYMTLSTDSVSVQLKSYALTQNVEGTLSLHVYSLPNSPLINGLDSFSTGNFTWAVDRNGNYFDVIALKLDEEGRLTLYLSDRDGVTTIKQFAYILHSSANGFGPVFYLTLLDGEKIYSYTDSYSLREARNLEMQGIDVSSMEETKITQIADTRKDLFAELQEGFDQAGITVTIDHSTGEIIPDQSVLFGYEETEISEEGKAFLQKFIDVSAGVILSEKYQQFIAAVVVEGHTDSVGTYENNLQFSRDRAASVAEFCLSEESGLDASYIELLQEMTRTEGYADTRPIYDHDGNVDQDASRRVSFRFLVRVD